MPTNKKRVKRSFTIKNDAENEWLDKQDNISLSLRLLIQNAIAQSGCQDYPTYLSSLVAAKNQPVTTPVSKSEKRQKEPFAQSTNPLTADGNGIKFMGTLDN